MDSKCARPDLGADISLCWSKLRNMSRLIRDSGFSVPAQG